MRQLEQTITTLEIAEMMEVKHWQILRKLDGTKKLRELFKFLATTKLLWLISFKNHHIKMNKEKKDHATK